MTQPDKSAANADQYKHTSGSFFRRHKLYLSGLLTGFGFGVFASQALLQDKNPLLYIGGSLMSVLGGSLYRNFKKNSHEKPVA